MGRGRAKAKQTKVARELKYSSHGTDLDALRAELITETGAPSAAPRAVVDDTDDAAGDDEEPDDPYARYVADDDEAAQA